MTSPWTEKRLHFVGIGGCGMSGLALAVSALGAKVTGSDQKESIFSRSLREAGIKVTIGHSASSVPTDCIVVYSSAIRPGNVEIAAAILAGIQQIHRSELLAELTASRQTVAVCGAHGKTTTTALLAYVLDECGLDPSYVVGGLPKPPMRHAYAGKSNLLVIEADESDRSLLRYKADIVVITNIDLDHIRDGGYKCRADVAEVIGGFAAQCRIAVAPSHIRRDINLENLITVEACASEDSTSFCLDGRQYRAHAPGLHQVENDSLVVRTALELGCDADRIDIALRTFPGLSRRFDMIGELGSGAIVIDDYAHHPAEIAVVIKAARLLRNGRVFVVFQPTLFSRTSHFAQAFAEALTLADSAYVEDIYAKRELPCDWPGVSRSLIIDQSSSLRHKTVRAAPERDVLVRLLDDNSRPSDCILLLGGGDIGELAQRLVQQGIVHKTGTSELR
jgi:UDP-N-acetylmuramate--alanine ligase